MSAANGCPAMAPLPLRVSDLVPLAGNPRRGDVDAVAASYAKFGQRKPIVVRPIGDGRYEVLAGNHQLQAAKRLGWETIAAVLVDDDDVTAKAYALADNRTQELGGYDTDALAEMVQDVSDASADLFSGTGYTADDLLALLGQGAGSLSNGPETPDPTGDTGDGGEGGSGADSGLPDPAPGKGKGLRDVTLVFDADDHGEFTRYVASAKDALGTRATTSELVLTALRSLVGTLDVADGHAEGHDCHACSTARFLRSGGEG